MLPETGNTYEISNAKPSQVGIENVQTAVDGSVDSLLNPDIPYILKGVDPNHTLYDGILKFYNIPIDTSGKPGENKKLLEKQCAWLDARADTMRLGTGPYGEYIEIDVSGGEQFRMDTAHVGAKRMESQGSTARIAQNIPTRTLYDVQIPKGMYILDRTHYRQIIEYIGTNIGRDMRKSILGAIFGFEMSTYHAHTPTDLVHKNPKKRYIGFTPHTQDSIIFPEMTTMIIAEKTLGMRLGHILPTELGYTM